MTDGQTDVQTDRRTFAILESLSRLKRNSKVCTIVQVLNLLKNDKKNSNGLRKDFKKEYTMQTLSIYHTMHRGSWIVRLRQLIFSIENAT